MKKSQKLGSNKILARTLESCIFWDTAVNVTIETILLFTVRPIKIKTDCIDEFLWLIRAYKWEELRGKTLIVLFRM